MWIFYCCQNVAIWGCKTLECLVNMAFSEFVLLLCKPFYSLWGNFCYPLSILFKLRIKLRFYCQKPDKHWTFGHRKNDLKDCSSRSLKDIKIYTLQDNGCCTITCVVIPTLLFRGVYLLYHRLLCWHVLLHLWCGWRLCLGFRRGFLPSRLS